MPSEVFNLMEACAEAAGDEGDAKALLSQCLQHDDWRVRYAAAVAIGDRREELLLPELMDQLAAEDAAPIYTQDASVPSLPAGASAELKWDGMTYLDAHTLEAWRRRGRLKQAIIWALTDIGTPSPRVLEVLQRYATDQTEDYPVRAASCRALGLLGDASVLPALEKACEDLEWCTRMEANKATRRIKARV